VSFQSWQETLIAAQIDGTALNTSTTATSIIPAAAKLTLPANFFAIGRIIRAKILGRISNINPTPGNFTIDMRFGSTVVANSGTVALNTAQANTNVAFEAELLATCRAIGASTSSNLMFQWKLSSAAFSLLATTPAATVFAPSSAPAVGTGFDATTAQVVDIFGTFSTSNANNGVTVHQYILESLN
jgi:hypothetical protein